jgi:hypothetical protein
MINLLNIKNLNLVDTEITLKMIRNGKRNIETLNKMIRICKRNTKTTHKMIKIGKRSTEVS